MILFLDYYCGREFFNGKISINGVESLPLSRVCQPELKRRIIGDTFMQIKDRIVEEVGSFLMINS